MPVTEEFVKMLMEEIVQLNQTIESLNQTIRELQEKLNQNSKNSSRPPSSDGLKKPLVNKDRSLRRPSGRKPGGQEANSDGCLNAPRKPYRTGNTTMKPSSRQRACTAALVRRFF